MSSVALAMREMMRGDPMGAAYHVFIGQTSWEKSASHSPASALQMACMSAETHIYLVRHGQTDWNVARKVMGKLAIPLNETGQAQAEAAKVFLAGVPVDHIFHSPHLRTRQTAQIIAQAHPHVL